MTRMNQTAVGIDGNRCAQRTPMHSGWPYGKPRQVAQCSVATICALPAAPSTLVRLAPPASGAVPQVDAQSQATPPGCARMKASPMPCWTHHSTHRSLSGDHSSSTRTAEQHTPTAHTHKRKLEHSGRVGHQSQATSSARGPSQGPSGTSRALDQRDVASWMPGTGRCEPVPSAGRCEPVLGRAQGGVSRCWAQGTPARP